MTARIAVLVSGNGSNLQAVADACAAGVIDGDIVLVVSNVAGAYALDRAAAAGLMACTVEAEPGEARPRYDSRLADVVAAHRPDIVLLAGWMRLLGATFLDRFPSRVVNLHPALPGELPGLHAIERAHTEARSGTRHHTGVTVHLVPDEGVDDGPVLATVTVPIHPDDTLHSLTERVHAAEHRLLVDTLAHLCRTLPAIPEEPTA